MVDRLRAVRQVDDDIASDTARSAAAGAAVERAGSRQEQQTGAAGGRTDDGGGTPEVCLGNSEWVSVDRDRLDEYLCSLGCFKRPSDRNVHGSGSVLARRDLGLAIQQETFGSFEHCDDLFERELDGGATSVNMNDNTGISHATSAAC